MKNEIIEYLERTRSDDVYRAEYCFRGLSKEEMQEQHGQSGRTRQQVLDGYREKDEKLNKMIKFIKDNY